MKNIILLLLIVFLQNTLFSQEIVSYFTGNNEDAVVQPGFGICLMGGATENDEAMIWFLEKANGGDVVVIRASGADGYNDYMYSELGITVNSVETFVFSSASQSSDPYVIEKLNNAEAIWIAGGDQYNYVQYWKNTPVMDALNHHINVKGGVIGGTSAGMAVLGDAYFSAENGTVSSDEALLNPFNEYVTIGFNDFIDVPFLENLITDSHYNNPDRRGRHVAFLARILNDHAVFPRGIAANEYVAVCIEENGTARVFGEYPDYEDYAYFLQVNCEFPQGPEVMVDQMPLTWEQSSEAVLVYKVPGTVGGVTSFNLSDWASGVGGDWEYWSVTEGNFNVPLPGNVPECVLSIGDGILYQVSAYPNPTKGIININFSQPLESDISIEIVDVSGRVMGVHNGLKKNTGISLDISQYQNGLYFIIINKIAALKILKS